MLRLRQMGKHVRAHARSTDASWLSHAFGAIGEGTPSWAIIGDAALRKKRPAPIGEGVVGMAGRTREDLGELAVATLADGEVTLCRTVLL